LFTLFYFNIGRGCGGRIFNIEGIITSPMYPSLYRKDAACKWEIAVPRPNPIRITFRGLYKIGLRSEKINLAESYSSSLFLLEIDLT
jgi:hypothetical protein